MKPSLFATLSALLVVLACNSVASEAKNTLRQYCNGSKEEYESGVSVGAGTRVHFNQASFSYVNNSTPISPPEEFIKKFIINDGGVSSECAEYLMSRAVSSGDQSLLARVYFAFDSSDLTAQSRYIIDQILVRIDHAGHLEVEGHTDSIGSEAYNFSLGMRRATSVTNYLASNGVPSEQLSIASKGENNPITNNQNKSERYLNRRVEIKAN